MQPRYDFTHFYQNEKLSDVIVLIRIDGDVKQRLPGHGIVLANVSNVFRDEIEQQQGLGGRPSIHLDVRADQVPAACALVRFVYTGELPDPASSQQLLLVHMLHLAHKFGVADCRTACYKVLLGCQQLQPESLGLAFKLLSPTSASAAATSVQAPAAAQHTAGAPDDFGPLLNHCLNQLQQQLGDLEAVLTCPSLLAQLHSLPLPALLALLHDDRTAAASENTVLAAVHSWMTAAAQRDVRVDAEHREQLAAAVRVPLLEPCYLATVLPRMAWLLEILGPQGLAAAAGVARGLCDPHAEPVLGNARACGSLSAGWLKGPRPMPNSCSRAMHGGPALTINWSLPLSDIKAAFEAACADAVAKALARQQREAAAAAAAAAAARQAALVSSQAPGWGLGFRSPLAPASATAAMNAVASFAGAAAARVFNKRKRSGAAESVDEGGRDQQSSSTAALGLGRGGQLQDAELENQEPESQHHEEHGLQSAEPLSPARSQGVQHAPQSQGGEDAEGLGQHTRKRRRRAAGPPTDAAGAEEAGAAAATTPRARGSQGGRKPSALQTAQQGNKALPHPLSPQAVGTGAAEAGAGGGLFSQDPVAASLPATPRADGSLSSGAQHLPRQFKLRSKEAQFAGYNWRLVMYFQPKGAAAGAAGAGAGADASEREECQADVQHGGTSGGVACHAVAAAHAVRLPDEGAGSAAAAAAAGVGNGNWTARLAVEAWPAVTLPPAISSSTVAFSGSLGVRLGQDGSEAAAAAAGGRRATAGRSQRPGRGRSAAAGGATRGAAGSQDAAPSPARRLNMTQPGDSPARYATCPEAAAAAAAGGSGGSRQQGGRERSPAGRKLAAGAAAGNGASGPRALAGLMSIPESDEDRSADESSSEELSSSSSEEGSESEEEEQEAAAAAAGQDSDCGDEGFTLLGEYPTGRTAKPAASSTPRSTGRRKQQQQGGRGTSSRRPASADSAGEQRQQQLVTPGAPAGHQADDDDKWRVLQLPQGSWLRSRRCDTGFTSFFSITLQQGVWDEAAWQPYLQPGNMLQLRANIWNVR